MAITYERVMKITYGKQLSFENWKRFACEMAMKGAYITNGACSVNPEEHQFREMSNEDTTYNIIVDGDEVGEIISVVPNARIVLRDPIEREILVDTEIEIREPNPPVMMMLKRDH